MAIVKFETADGPIYVEVADNPNAVVLDVPSTSAEGLHKASVSDRAADKFDEAIQSARPAVEAFRKFIVSLETPPSEVELKFGFKASAEVSGFIFAKAGGEATFELKLVWKR